MCELCYGVSNGGCPCEEPTEYVKCPRCDEEGYLYYNDEGEEITRELYDALPESERSEEKCDKCNGSGVVPE